MAAVPWTSLPSRWMPFLLMDLSAGSIPPDACVLPREHGGSSSWMPFMLLGSGVLAGMAIYNRVQAVRSERRHPPVGQFVTIDGVRLHYVDRGQGQPLVFLHGNGAMIRDFEDNGVLSLAAERYRVIAFDRPGYGYSDRPRSSYWTPTQQAHLLHRAFRKLSIERPVVVGHSWGALVTAALAVQYPQALSGIVLLSGYFFPSLRKDVFLLSLLALPGIGDVLRHTLLPIAGRMLAPRLIQKLFTPSPVPGYFADFPVELPIRPSHLRASAEEYAVMTPAAVALAKQYRQINLPAVIVAGDGDQIVDFREHSLRMHHEIAGSRMMVLPGVGHMPHHDRPECVLAAIDEVQAQAG